MANPAIEQWLRQYLSQGYDLGTLKNNLLQHGYQEKDIDEAVRAIYGNEVKHVIHLSKTTVAIVIAVLFTIVIATGGFLYFTQEKTPAQLLDVSTEIINPTLAPGEKLNFNVELSSLGSQKRYDVELRYTVEKDASVITFKEETTGIETSKSFRASIDIPANAEPGAYLLRTVASYDERIARSVSSFGVAEKSIATCSDNIKNQGETGIDCGGPCNSCPSCSDGIRNQGETDIDCGGPCNACKVEIECNDNDKCTTDILVNGRCQFTRVTPCCGDDICDKSEVQQCLADCPTDDPFAGMTAWEKLDAIKELAATNNIRAAEYCNTFDSTLQKEKCLDNVARSSLIVTYCELITDEKTREECIIDVAQNSKQPLLCDKVLKDIRKDRCLIHFAKTGIDYTVCDKISDYYLKQLCNSMKSMRDSQASIQ